MKQISIVLILLSLLYSCNEKIVKQSDLVKRNKLYYSFDEPKSPFTGKSLDYFKKSGLLRSENEYSDGILIYNKRYAERRDSSVIWKEREFWKETGYKKHFLIYDIKDENKNKIVDLESEIYFSKDGELIKHKKFNTEGKTNKHIITEYYKGKNNPIKKEFFASTGKTLTITYENGRENEYFIDDKKVSSEKIKEAFTKEKDELKNN